MTLTELSHIGVQPVAGGTVTLDAAEWQRLRQRIEAETGMDFSGARLARLQDAVRRVCARGKAPVNLGRLLAAPSEPGPWLEQLSAELTVGETFFFRNEYHFRSLREQVLPQILRENADRREIRIWSAGCASGEEPYSLAILLDQVLRGQPWHVSILGTDLNLQFLQRGRDALYRPWSFRHTNIHADRQYFTAEGDAFRLAARVRNGVRFAYLNLVKDVYPSPLTGTLGLDLILFRNVAIYLKPEVTRAILARFHRALRPGGWLLLGETEVGLAPSAGFDVRRFDQATFYQAVGAAVPPVAADAVPPPLPVLATLSLASPRWLPTVPSLPAWGPLPTKGGTDLSRASQHRPPEVAPWERIERAVAARDFEEAERTLGRLPGLHERAPLRLRYVQSLLTCAEIARARRMLEVCLKEEPLLIAAQLLQASFAEEAGDLRAAEQAYRRALYSDRNCPMAHFHLGLVLDQSGDRAGAKRSWTTTLRLLHGQNPQALVDYGEGICYGRLTEMVKAILGSGGEIREARP